MSHCPNTGSGGGLLVAHTPSLCSPELLERVQPQFKPQRYSNTPMKPYWPSTSLSRVVVWRNQSRALTARVHTISSSFRSGSKTALSQPPHAYTTRLNLANRCYLGASSCTINTLASVFGDNIASTCSWASSAAGTSGWLLCLPAAPKVNEPVLSSLERTFSSARQWLLCSPLP